MHLECGGVDQQARADELLVQFMVAQHVAYVLAQEALDAFAKFLNALDILLHDSPGAVRSVRLARPEQRDFFLVVEIPLDVGDEILDARKGMHRLEGDRFVERQGIHSRHAHQARMAVDLRGAGAALAGLAVPSHRKIVGLLGLDQMHDVEDNRPFFDLGFVFLEIAAVRIAAPDAEGRLSTHLFSSMIWFSSGGISLIGSRRIFIVPSLLAVMIFTLPNSSLLVGKSSRKCPPRLSL